MIPILLIVIGIVAVNSIWKQKRMILNFVFMIALILLVLNYLGVLRL